MIFFLSLSVCQNSVTVTDFLCLPRISTYLIQYYYHDICFAIFKWAHIIFIVVCEMHRVLFLTRNKYNIFLLLTISNVLFSIFSSPNLDMNLIMTSGLHRHQLDLKAVKLIREWDPAALLPASQPWCVGVEGWKVGRRWCGWNKVIRIRNVWLLFFLCNVSWLFLPGMETFS